MTQNGAQSPRKTSRRQVLVAGGAVIAVAGTGGALAVNALSGGEEAPVRTKGGEPSAGASCYRLSEEAIEGPYYIDADRIRANITEGKKGVPLTLAIKVIDSETCKPVRDAAVDIWHCDALGIYSGYESVGSALPSGMATESAPADDGSDDGSDMHVKPTDDARYLRGTQRTDQAGKVRFTSIFPGWYEGRAVHIHMKAQVDGTWTEGGYEGGRTCHTGQLYFEEEAVLAVAEKTPYSGNTVKRVTLPEDILYDDSGATGGLLTLRYDKKKIANGVTASITVGVDPEATNDGHELIIPSAPPSA
ncbi:MAG TPA: intradiol ring-cleavage dioxygenase [Streptomyces sp.]|uniref:intradiol ring-cleavage dioxygenase n=1 Tax=Streptomyces sp. TaxID=1931 RepID=UPI002BBFF21B|nr:intradiol ring-cleavage dioxygenase [Streptomyces sp.]HWU11796.1 intradiol ring-cleavage dioxygenase [Streptomyces sp.]